MTLIIFLYFLFIPVVFFCAARIFHNDAPSEYDRTGNIFATTAVTIFWPILVPILSAILGIAYMYDWAVNK